MFNNDMTLRRNSFGASFIFTVRRHFHLHKKIDMVNFAKAKREDKFVHWFGFMFSENICVINSWIVKYESALKHPLDFGNYEY